MKKVLGVLLAAVVLVSCTLAPAQESPTPVSGVLLSNVSRVPADAEAATEAARAINDFGLDLYRRLVADKDVNTVISPASIAIALSMARLGARGTTADEMDAVLHGLLAGGPDAINSLDQALAARNREVRDAHGDRQQIVLRIANAPFAQQDYGWHTEYLDALAASFGAGMRTVDYHTNPEGAREQINRWVSEQTEERIPELLGPGTIDSATRLTLVNAIYLKAPWMQPFYEDATKPAPFHRLDGSSVDVPMMSGLAYHAYAAGDGWQAVELPYAGEELAMLLILADDLAAFTGRLDGAMLASITDALANEWVSLAMPLFETETSAELNDDLIAVGMPTAFSSGGADFSGMTDQERLFIALVAHQANITVDEKGTEAAAATAVAMAGSIPPPPTAMSLDHPFLFVLRDRTTGAVLFLGQIVDPSAD
ncbi:serpin family protein [soil metagenome]